MARVLGRDCHLTHKARALAVISLLAISLTLLPQERPVHSYSPSNSPVWQGINTYSTGIFGSPPRFNFSSLMYLTGNGSSVYDFEETIEQFLLPLNVHMILIDIGWHEHANTSTTKIEHKQWIDNWLTACDAYDIKNIFFFKELGVSRQDGWTHDLLVEYPETRTYDKSGNPLDYFSIDDPAILKQLQGDLKQLYSYYGNHTSWIGISDGAAESSLYGLTGEELRDFGYSNLTIARFTSSEYLWTDISASGLHRDGTQCLLWRMFKDLEPTIVLSSGTWVDSLGVDVFDIHELAVRVRAPSELQGFKVAWYGKRIGDPSTLVVELYDDNESGFPEASDHPIESVAVHRLSVTMEEAWQPFVTFESKLSKGKYYTFVFRSENGDDSNKYVILYRHNVDDGSTASTGYERRWREIGAAILWLQSTDGSNVNVWPLQQTAPAAFNYNTIEQTFVAPSQLRFNSVLFLMGERQYDEANATIRIIRLSDGRVLATGLLNQSVVHGLQMWVPIPLDATVSTEPGQEYGIQIDGMPSGRQPYSFLRIHTDPDFAAFQGQGSHLIFRLALLRIGVENLDFTEMKQAPPDQVTGASQVAVRFDVPSPTKLETLSFVVAHIEGDEDLTVALQPGNETAESPAPLVLWNTSIPASQIPEAGWVRVTDINTTVSAPQRCWIVFRTGPKTTYSLPGLSSPYKHLVKVSKDSARTWTEPREPMEIAFEVLGISGAKGFTAGQPVEMISETPLSESTWLAQSFFSPQDVQLKGLFLGPMRGSTMGEVRVTLRTNSGQDTPSPEIIADGTYPISNLTIFRNTLDYVNLETIAHLSAGRKYWITIEPIKGSFKFSTILYKDSVASYGGSTSTAKISTDRGEDWIDIGERNADILFALVELSDPRPTFATEDLVSDIEDHHTSPVSEMPLHGWNSYLNVKQAELFESLIDWFRKYTGRDWTFVGNTPLSIFKQMPLQSQVFVSRGAGYSPMVEMFSVGTNRLLALSSQGRDPLSIEETRAMYLLEAPLLARPIVALNDWSPRTLAENDQWACPLGFTEILSRMRTQPDYFGKEKGASNVLALAGEDEGFALHFLSSALNITSASGRGEDLNLTRFGTFDQFDALLWLDGHPSLSDITDSAQERILSFVEKGGGLVVTDTWPDWISPAIGLRYVGGNASQTEVTYANYSHPILRPLKDLGAYRSRWRAQSFEQVSTHVKFIVRDSKGTPWITENSFGAGRTVFCGAPDMQPPENATASPSELYLTLLNNALLYAAKKEQMLPVWWYRTYQEKPGETQLLYSVCGRPGGPILLWLSNSGSETTFQIDLNGTFYGLDPDGWMVLDITSWTAASRGVGTDILINTTVPARSWKPLYLLNQTDDLSCVYSNSFLSSSMIYPGQAVHVVRHHPEQTSWIIIQSDTPIEEVQVNDRTIQSYPSSPALNASESKEGWFRDPHSHLLLVKFQASGREDVVRLIQKTEPAPPWETIQQATILGLVLTAIGLELLFLAKRRGRHRSTSGATVTDH